MTWTKELVQAALDTGMTIDIVDKLFLLQCATISTCEGCMLLESSGECTYPNYTDLDEVITEHFPEALI